MHPIVTSAVKPGDGITAPLRIVLQLRRDGPFPYEFVTHMQNMQDKGFYHGHYFESLKNAAEDYEERCAKLEVDPYPKEEEDAED